MRESFPTISLILVGVGIAMFCGALYEYWREGAAPLRIALTDLLRLLGKRDFFLNGPDSPDTMLVLRDLEQNAADGVVEIYGLKLDEEGGRKGELLVPIPREYWQGVSAPRGRISRDHLFRYATVAHESTWLLRSNPSTIAAHRREGAMHIDYCDIQVNRKQGVEWSRRVSRWP